MKAIDSFNNLLQNVSFYQAFLNQIFFQKVSIIRLMSFRTCASWLEHDRDDDTAAVALISSSPDFLYILKMLIIFGAKHFK